MCLDEVLLGTLSVGVQEPEAALGVGVSLLGGHAIPADGLTVALRDALPIGVEQSQIKLGIGVPLFGRAAIPKHGLSVVLLDAVSFLIQHSQVVLGDTLTAVIDQAQTVLGVGVSLLGQRAPHLQGGGVIAGFVGRHAFLEVGHGGGGQAREQ